MQSLIQNSIHLGKDLGQSGAFAAECPMLGPGGGWAPRFRKCTLRSVLLLPIVAVLADFTVLQAALVGIDILRSRKCPVRSRVSVISPDILRPALPASLILPPPTILQCCGSLLLASGRPGQMDFQPGLGCDQGDEK